MLKSLCKPLILMALPLFVFTAGCQAEQKSVELETLEQKASYGIGLDFGTQMTESELGLDKAALIEGVKDGFNGGEAKLTEEELEAVKAEFITKLQEESETEMESAAGENLEEGRKFLEQNADKEGVETTESGLQYKVLTPGTGETPSKSDTVKVHYRGTLTDGTVFDSSYERGEPAEFPVQGLIPAWQEALPMMKEGAKWKLFVPSELAYGEQGAGQVIGPNEVLIFEMELIEIL
ncbi:MAG: FKBP-type peptidyl-prolyl cis-trans isomerase [Desulfuromonadales bacterium]